MQRFSTPFSVMRTGFAFALAAGLVAGVLPHVTQAAGGSKQLQRVRGTVGYSTDKDAADFKTVFGKLDLPDNDYAVTKAQSAAVLAMPDSSLISLGENTSVRVGAFDSASASPGSTITVDGGALRFEIKRPEGGVANYKFVTPTSQVAVRGTVGLLAFVNGVTTVGCVACAADSVAVTVGSQTLTLVTGQFLTVSALGAITTGALSGALGAFTGAGVPVSGASGAAAAGIPAAAGGAAAGAVVPIAAAAVAGGTAIGIAASNKSTPAPQPTATAAPTSIPTASPRPSPSPSPSSIPTATPAPGATPTGTVNLTGHARPTPAAVPHPRSACSASGAARRSASSRTPGLRTVPAMNKRIAIALALFLLAGCGGGGGSSSVPGASAQTQAKSVTGSVVISIPIASAATQSSSRTARYPQFVSPNASSVALSINGGANVFFDVSATSSLCTTVSGARNCTLTFGAPVGSDTFAFLVFQGRQRNRCATRVGDGLANDRRRNGVQFHGGAQCGDRHTHRQRRRNEWRRGLSKLAPSVQWD